MLFNLEKLKDIAYKLETMAIDYHTNKERCVRSEQEIKLAVQRLSQYINIHQVLSDDDRIKTIKSIRKSITLENFESKEHKALQDPSPIIAKINNAFTNLIDLSEREFRANFPLRNKGFWKSLA